jgi:hypothetical protein
MEEVSEKILNQPLGIDFTVSVPADVLIERLPIRSCQFPHRFLPVSLCFGAGGEKRVPVRSCKPLGIVRTLDWTLAGHHPLSYSRSIRFGNSVRQISFENPNKRPSLASSCLPFALPAE